MEPVPSAQESNRASAPRLEYQGRLAARQEQQARLARRWRRLVRMRRIVLGLIVGIAWLGDRERLPVKVALLTGPAVLFEVLVARRNRTLRDWRRTTLAVVFYEQRLERLNDCWSGHGTPGTRYLDASHPAAADLDLFGSGCLFELLCTPCSHCGQDTLADWLRGPAGPEEVRCRQAAVAELTCRLDLRESLALLSAEGQVDVDPNVLRAWGLSPPLRLGKGTRWTIGVLAGFPLIALVGGCLVGAGLIPFLVVLLLGRLVVRGLGGRLREIVDPIEVHRTSFLSLAALLERLKSERFTAPLLAGQLLEIDPAPRQFRRLGQLLGRLPLTGFLVGREPVALMLNAWREQSGPALARWLTALGQMEALCALAAYAYENPADPYPEVVTEGPCFEAQGLRHPLLPREHCVPNDVCLAGPLRLLMVSGSNMSGKSTLLRCVGVNTVLALAGAPVRAQHLRLSPLMVGATLRIQDSLQAGRSRFYAEILRVRQLLDLARGAPPLLFLLDELFQGTSSYDRQQGAQAVLRRLIDAGAIGLVTTHDLALTQLAEVLAPRAANVHFEDRFEDGKMAFDFRMRPGVVPSSNGLALMRAVGIEV